MRCSTTIAAEAEGSVGVVVMDDEVPLSELVAGARSGSSQAWNAIVQRHAALVYGVARSYRLSPADAQDVSQTVWLRLVEHLDQVDQPDSLRGWLSTTTRRECLRVHRLAARQSHAELDDQTVSAGTVVGGGAEPPAVEEAVLRVEREAALREAFAGLGERCRTLLSLLVSDLGPSYRQVGEQLGIPVGSIGPTRARCLDNLRRALERLHHSSDDSDDGDVVDLRDGVTGRPRRRS